jgi:hypothetical protein
VNLDEELVSALEEIDRLKERIKSKKRNFINMKRRIMMLMKQKKKLSS